MSTGLPNVTPLLQGIARRRLLVVGDFMLDRTVYGQAQRISPEAPTPVISVREIRQSLGGAGNVVRNIDSLGGQACCAAVVGDDEPGKAIERELRGICPPQELRVIREQGRTTTLKTRVVAMHPGHPTRLQDGAHQQVLRVDEESCHPVSTETVTQVLEFSEALLKDVDGMVVSDYAKGALPSSMLQRLIQAARTAGKPVFVDPKGKDWSRYKDASVLTPNTAEAEAALGTPLSKSDSGNGARWEETAQRYVKDLRLDALLITRGAEGLTLVDPRGVQHLPTSRREVFDVTGAGDTLISAFSLAACSGMDFIAAAQFGNLAAGVAVGKAGAAAVYPYEVEREWGVRHLSAGAKRCALEPLAHIVEGLRRDGKKIVFTNGCFDLLHIGHVHLLSEAKKLGDVLVVAINSDASVRRLKGDGRPIVAEEDRAGALAALESVDYVVIFDEPDPLNLLQCLRPDVLVKGDQYAESEVVGGDFVKSYGGVIGRIPIRKGISTTDLVKKIQSARGGTNQ